MDLIKKIGMALLLTFALVAPVSAGTAILSWTANTETDLAGYKLYQGTASGVYGTPLDVGNVVTRTLPGLADGTYFWVLTAYDADGNESGFSLEVTKTFTTVPPPPATFTLVASTPPTTLSWGAVSGAGRYEILWGDTPGSYFGSQDRGLNLTFDTAAFTPGTTRNFIVRAFDSASAQIAQSNELIVAFPATPPPPDTTPPAPPVGLTVEELLAIVIQQNNTMIALLNRLVDVH